MSKFRFASALAAFTMCATLMYAQGSASGYLYVYPSAYPVQQGVHVDKTDIVVWQTGNTQSGIYFYTIRDTNGLIQSGRIVIAK